MNVMEQQSAFDALLFRVHFAVCKIGGPAGITTAKIFLILTLRRSE
jgi:hypothetical protein